MKRIIGIASVIAILLSFALPLGVFAQGIGGPYTTGVQVQNLSASAQATILMQFYNQDGTLAGAPTDTIAASGSKTYFPLNVTTGFNGSMVISSDQPIAAIANVIFPDGSGGAAYSSFNAGGTTVNLPLMMKNNFGIDTWFNIQNAGTGDATVSIAFKPGTCTDSKTVKPGASVTVNQGNNACLPDHFVGAASLTSTNGQPIVATVMQVVRGSKSLLAYRGFTSASTNPVMPLVSSNFYSSGTGIQIQNTGGSATSVTLTYTPSGGTYPGATCTETRSIAAGASTTFGYPQLPAACGTMTTGVTDSVYKGFVGSARVTGNSTSQNLVAIVNEVTRGTANGDAYQGVNPALATAHVSMPLIMDRNFHIFTGLSVVNVGASPTTVNCTFTGSARTLHVANLAPGAALTDVQLNNMSNGYVGGATCTATGGDAKIAGIVNELTQGLPATSDALLVYDAFNY